MLKVKINVPFEALLETDANNYGYIDHPLITACIYGKVSKAKKALQTFLVKEVEEGLQAKKNTTARAIGLDTGDVFIVRYGIGGWSYSIVGKGRTFGGSCLLRENTFQSTYDAAKKHAESQGTIVYDCSF